MQNRNDCKGSRKLLTNYTIDFLKIRLSFREYLVYGQRRRMLAKIEDSENKHMNEDKEKKEETLNVYPVLTNALTVLRIEQAIKT